MKTDSYVIQSNVHFPTDYNLLYDSSRKCLDIIQYFLDLYSCITGWRKLKAWRRILKNGSRSVGNASRGGGKNKEARQSRSVRLYLIDAQNLSTKLHDTIESLPVMKARDIAQIEALEVYLGYLDKHIDLLERRIIKGETIPHGEKMFSIFETYTEWISKGKLHPSVELGKKLLITTDQNNLIVDYQVMDHLSDSESVRNLVERITSKYPEIETWSFDKGFYSKDNKAFIMPYVNHLIMPKRGKRNSLETEYESTKTFKLYKGKHSAIESNINELENCGLGRCPDKGYAHFKRYIGLGVIAYNLRKIGKKLIEQDCQINLRCISKAA